MICNSAISYLDIKRLALSAVIVATRAIIILKYFKMNQKHQQHKHK